MPKAEFQARRYKRVDLKAFAAVSAAGKKDKDISREYNSSCINISEGGCCLRLDMLLSGADIDFGLDIGIELPDGKPRLIAHGKIAWLKEETGEKMSRYIVGVKFHDLKEDDRKRINEFILKQTAS